MPAWLLDDHVGDPPLLGSIAAAALWQALVVGVGELGDDVPRVEEAGHEAERAEEDVDERVGGADAALDPDCGGEVG